MYMLRLISAVLHRDPGPAVPEAALDLRPAELGILVPLIACLLALSAWPAAISENAIESSSANPPLARIISSGPFTPEALSGARARRLNDEPPEGVMDFVRPQEGASTAVVIMREHRPKR
jgi:hypothetical protein